MCCLGVICLLCMGYENEICICMSGSETYFNFCSKSPFSHEQIIWGQKEEEQERIYIVFRLRTRGHWPHILFGCSCFDGSDRLRLVSKNTIEREISSVNTGLKEYHCEREGGRAFTNVFHTAYSLKSFIIWFRAHILNEVCLFHFLAGYSLQAACQKISCSKWPIVWYQSRRFLVR